VLLRHLGGTVVLPDAGTAILVPGGHEHAAADLQHRFRGALRGTGFRGLHRLQPADHAAEHPRRPQYGPQPDRPRAAGLERVPPRPRRREGQRGHYRREFPAHGADFCPHRPGLRAGRDLRHAQVRR